MPTEVAENEVEDIYADHTYTKKIHILVTIDVELSEYGDAHGDKDIGDYVQQAVFNAVKYAEDNGYRHDMEFENMELKFIEAAQITIPEQP